MIRGALVLAVALAGAPGAAARSIDTAVLLSFKGPPAQGHAALRSWADLGGVSPCAVGWSSFTGGWHGVQCDRCAHVPDTALCHALGSGFAESEGVCVPRCSTLVADARVTRLDLSGTGVPGSIEILGQLSALVELKLYNTNVVGSIGSLAPLLLLQDLRLHMTGVHGTPTFLGPLISLTWLSLYGSVTDPNVGVLATRAALTNLFPNCNAGRYSVSAADGTAACTACAVGKYLAHARSVAASECTDCAAGMHASAVGSASCTDCTSGKHLAALGSSNPSDCIDCVAGRFTDANETNCAALGSGFIGSAG